MNENKEDPAKFSLFPLQTVQQDTWAGAVKEFFKQLGSVTALLILALTAGQGCGFLDIYRLLDK